MKKRELCGIYFRVERNGKYENICFTDMTEKEQLATLNGLSFEASKKMCMWLARIVRNLGDMFDVGAEKGEEK